jgi:uncharacterized protein (DUF885 family)
MAARTPPASAPKGADRRLRAFLTEDWQRWMRLYPEVATVVGFPGQNDRWTDDSPAGVKARQRQLEASVHAFEGIDARALSPRERLNHRLYRELLRLAVAGQEFGDDPLPYHFGLPHSLWMPLNQMDGIHITAGQLLPLQPRRTAVDVEAIVARLRALPAAVEQNLALLRDGARRGYTPPRVAVRGVPDQVAGLVPEEPGRSALCEPFAALPATLSADDRRRLTREVHDLYARSVRPAFLNLLRYLREEYLPRARETTGASELPNGRSAYRHHVRWTTTTDLTPEQIHEIGLAEVRRTRAEIESLVRSTGFAGTLAEFHRAVRTDPKFRHPSAEGLVTAYRALAKRIDPELAHLFGTLPRLPYGVVPVPDFQAPSSPAAYYMSGSPEDGRPGLFYANADDLASRPTWRMESLTLHEAVPGHHLQLALAAELPDVPEFRRFSGETAFVEGWGLYAETLGAELGLYRDPYARFGALDHDIWRSIRLVVDTGMHALGWSRDQAIAFFRDNTGMSDHDITVEVDRYIVWPAQALAYKIGQLKFRELRTAAERELGERFDVRRFHDVVLEEGGLPLGELEARVRAWIDRTRAGAKASGRKRGAAADAARPRASGSRPRPARRRP